MSPSESHHVHRRTLLRGAAFTAAGAAVTPLLRATPAAAAATSGEYVIRFDQGPKQTILGLGFEIQSDSIGSGNNGLPEEVSGVPYDLTPSERTRFYQEMLKGGRSDRGFRYCRLAMGLYYRGLSDDKKRLKGRYPGQTALLADMISQAGIEGISAEYWSPATYWKTTGGFVGGTLTAFDDVKLNALGDAMVADLTYLTSYGVPISAWGLQNEPNYGDRTYSCCYYEPQNYLKAFKRIAPKIRANFPHVQIHADSLDGAIGLRGQLLRADPEALKYVDAWTYHRIGSNSEDARTSDYFSLAGKSSYADANDNQKDQDGNRLVYNNEFEYLVAGPSSDKPPAYKCVNTAQSIMNWMTFQNARTWYWLHALKPIANSEATGYALGYWRPPSDTDFSRFPDLQAGHWTWNPQNWNGVAGFVRYMPWDSVRYGVDEAAVSPDHRIMAWKTPGGKPVFALTNRSADTSYTYTIDSQTAATFQGYRFGLTTTNEHLGAKAGPTLTITVPPSSIEFWVRNY
ncbi:hypothetical protein [Streptomyces luteogriseus]|uniref:hypothetical protein n=1 Tax=Streptomyces luteogriseus TaxID=68233 RepID=UPI002E3350A4|nr:hypothetical protein [Streptomyces luteogriseus]WTJ25623.1 hypothetical protein OID52_00345 [Streptomyces luteogriseus]